MEMEKIINGQLFLSLSALNAQVLNIFTLVVPYFILIKCLADLGRHNLEPKVLGWLHQYIQIFQVQSSIIQFIQPQIREIPTVMLLNNKEHNTQCPSAVYDEVRSAVAYHLGQKVRCMSTVFFGTCYAYQDSVPSTSKLGLSELEMQMQLAVQDFLWF